MKEGGCSHYRFFMPPVLGPSAEIGERIVDSKLVDYRECSFESIILSTSFGRRPKSWWRDETIV
jgi:hypothetical protein